jgi:NADPH:quinone reductase-like Zn-dependent oxidoreductase
LVKSLGADEVVDYTREDFSKAGRVYDMVMDTVGKSGFSRSMKSLKRGGFYVLVAGSMLSSWLGGMWVSISGAGKVISGITGDTPGGQSFLKELIEAGKLRTVIDRCYSLNEIAEAHRYVEAGHKKGNVVIILEQN